ncbi:MAG TPA: transglycosylase domain-containing protein, partial [Chloroflexota bacterium]|nr:transglycosylase domain-containing protein [Chloroflexota bacterium]
MATTSIGRRPPRPAPASGRLERILTLFAVALTGALALLFAGTAAVYAVFSRNLPSPAQIAERHNFESTKIFDRNGVLLHEVYDPNKGKRVSLQLNEIPEHVRKTFLAAEDARFYENAGVDLQAIVRAALNNARGEQIAGGSTITQQLVKMTLLTDERSMVRKIKEAILAIKISRTYSKDQILEMYLNTAFFGNQAYGVESAAQTYFAKPVSEVNQAEAALLAGLVRSPSGTNPFKDEGAAKNEQKRVLDQMVKHKMLTPEQAGQVQAEPLTYNTKQFSELKAPHFAIWIREQLEANPKYGKDWIYQRGLEVTTTLDYRMQEMAELLVRDHVSKLGAFNVSDGALVALNPATGEILAMVGSADYNNKQIKGEVNVAVAQRQPGSSIKPITYLAAFQKGWTPGTVIEDTPTSFPQGPGQPPYTPKNYDGTFRGKVTARQALAMSLNIPAVKALQFAGIPSMVDLAKKMGIQSFQDPSKYGLALTLGGGEVRLLELTGAYSVFANQGKYVPPVAILKVTDTQGKVLDQWPGARPQPVVDPGRAYMVTSVLKDNDARAPAFGANSPLRLTRPAAVKTGTTDDFKDNWTV